MRLQALLLSGLITACSHPLEIVGEGDILSASGTRDCSLADFRAGKDKCTSNLVVNAYQETYTAAPASGWEFDKWLNYCETNTSPSCRFNVPASEVGKHWGKSAPPLVAVFRETVQPTRYPYGLPDPLVSESGSPILEPSQWYSLRRPETLELFAEHIYGRTPAGALSSRYYDFEVDRNALGGIATRKQLRRELKNSQGSVVLDILLYLPNEGAGPYPVFLGLNFNGNHTINSDSNIRLPRGWVEATENNRASANDRGNRKQRWNVEELIARGYGVATVYYGDMDPDYDDGFQNGVHPLFYSAGASEPAANEWGSIGAWAWGLSRVLDYLLVDPEVSPGEVAVMGFSRLGKAALWAAAQDERFAMAISNNSGTLGASLSRREGIAQGKEPLSQISSRFGYWFARNMAQYVDNPGLLPVDQHQLIALIAPRPVYIASASNDLWADPLGEFEGGKYASKVYQLLGKDGFFGSQSPASHEQIDSVVGYHLRPGNHEVTLYDWQRFMDFADLHLGGG